MNYEGKRSHEKMKWTCETCAFINSSIYAKECGFCDARNDGRPMQAKKLCAICKRFRGKRGFAQSQWQRFDKIMICRSCVQQRKHIQLSCHQCGTETSEFLGTYCYTCNNVYCRNCTVTVYMWNEEHTVRWNCPSCMKYCTCVHCHGNGEDKPNLGKLAEGLGTDVKYLPNTYSTERRIQQQRQQRQLHPQLQQQPQQQGTSEALSREQQTTQAQASQSQLAQNQATVRTFQNQRSSQGQQVPQAQQQQPAQAASDEAQSTLPHHKTRSGPTLSKKRKLRQKERYNAECELENSKSNPKSEYTKKTNQPKSETNKRKRSWTENSDVGKHRHVALQTVSSQHLTSPSSNRPRDP